MLKASNFAMRADGGDARICSWLYTQVGGSDAARFRFVSSTIDENR